MDDSPGFVKALAGAAQESNGTNKFLGYEHKANLILRVYEGADVAPAPCYRTIGFRIYA